jgi:hypothetical protein
MPNGDAQLDIRPDGLNWQWSIVPADRARQALACALAAISGGWKLYLSLPDDPTSDVLEIIGLSRTRDRPEPPLLYQSAAGIGGYDLRGTGDQAFAFDYDSSGKLDHLVLYRPGTGTIWILKNSGGAFSPVYQMGAPGSGIGGYDLADPADQAFAFDYDITGKLDHLVLYRPGHNTIWILRNNAGTFEAVYRSDTGIRGYDLADPRDRAFAFDYNSNRRLDNLVLYRPGTGMIWILNSLV